ncbi:hypothetical protein Tco_0098675 [Tanacetum coccineum]
MDDDTKDVEEESLARVMQRWKAEEEKLLCETWIEVSESNAIGADRNLDTFWWQVTHAFNKATRIVNRTKDMIMDKWATVNETCLSRRDNFRKICRWWEVDFMEVHMFDE